MMVNERSECEAALQQWFELISRISIRNSYLFFRERNVSHSQVIVLHMLQRGGAVRVSDVSRALSVSNPAASQMLDQLVRAQLISRHEQEDDRRLRIHELTDKGVGLLRQAAIARQKWQTALIDTLNKKEQQDVKRILRLLNQKLSAIEQSDGFGGPECIGGEQHD